VVAQQSDWVSLIVTLPDFDSNYLPLPRVCHTSDKKRWWTRDNFSFVRASPTPASKMPQSPLPRNTFVYDANVPQGAQPQLVAGFNQLGRTTGGEFYFCLEFCFTQPQPGQFRLLSSIGMILPRDATIVPAGSYMVVTLGFPNAISHLKSSGPDCLCISHPNNRDCSSKEYFRRKSG